MTKVVHLQYGFSAASPGNRLHKALLKEDVSSSLVVLHNDKNGDEAVFSLGRKARLISKLNNWIQDALIRKTNEEYGGYSYPTIGSNVSVLKVVQEADVIYLHWILNGFLSLKNIEQLAQLNKPVVLVMHDMWTITGGCFHSFDCQKFLSKCGSCQLFPGNKARDWSTMEFEKKMQLFSTYDNISFVAPSKWLFDNANKSALTKGKRIFHIPNALDVSLFKPFDRQVAKQILNIDPNERVIAFGAQSIDSPYKGWKYLKEALDLLWEERSEYNIRLLVFGSAPSAILQEAIPFEMLFVGYIVNEYATNLMYNAADVFLAPSVADNLPYAVLESESCGTPVVAFEVGGMPEMIRHKENGYLAKYRDSSDLVNGIKYCIDNSLKGYMLDDFAQAEVSKKHMKLIEEVTNR